MDITTLDTLNSIKAKHKLMGELIADLEITLRIRQELNLPMTGKITFAAHELHRDLCHRGPGHGMKGIIRVSHDSEPGVKHVKDLKHLSPELATLIWDNYPHYAKP